jgi:hypothetical protein
MLTMDIFQNDAFSAIEMTAALDRVDYKPGFLSGMSGLYIPRPVRTTSVFIEERQNGPALIQTSERGTPPKEKGGEKRKLRAFKTDRIALGSTIYADEIQGVRAFGSETELKTAMGEVSRRQFLIRQDVDLTKEYHLLGMVQGQFVDADGTVIYDWATEFSQTQMAEVDFDLDNAAPTAGALRKRCNAFLRATLKALKGLGGTGVRVIALCGDDFYDALTTHVEVRQTFLNWQAAADLRDKVGAAYEAFSFGGITWYNYRGTDDGTTVGIPATKCRLFPLGAGIFQMAYSPAETFDFVNTLGQEVYSWMVYDRDRNAWVRVELASYPLPVCVQPAALGSGKLT